MPSASCFQVSSRNGVRAYLRTASRTISAKSRSAQSRLAKPTSAKPGGRRPRFARSYTAGMSFFRDRSPVTPKITSALGPAILFNRGSSGERSGFCTSSDRETKCPHHVSAVVGDALGRPRRHPHPVDAECRHEAVKRLGNVVLDHVGKRAARARQRHADHERIMLFIECQIIDQAEIDNVAAQLGIGDIFERLNGLLFELWVDRLWNGRGFVAHKLSLDQGPGLRSTREEAVVTLLLESLR